MSFLTTICKKYTAHLTRMSRTYDRAALLVMEDQRAELHNQVIDALRAASIKYIDRWHVTEIAEQIANE